MLRYFVPYVNEKPASIIVKGHKLVLVSTDSRDLLKGLAVIGADRVEEIQVEENAAKQDLFISNLAQSVHGGVVMAPPGVDLRQVLEGLEHELPWMH